LAFEVVTYLADVFLSKAYKGMRIWKTCAAIDLLPRKRM
jgi:hypothetical protein